MAGGNEAAGGGAQCEGEGHDESKEQREEREEHAEGGSEWPHTHVVLRKRSAISSAETARAGACLGKKMGRKLRAPHIRYVTWVRSPSGRLGRGCEGRGYVKVMSGTLLGGSVGVGAKGAAGGEAHLHGVYAEWWKGTTAQS